MRRFGWCHAVKPRLRVGLGAFEQGGHLAAGVFADEVVFLGSSRPLIMMTARSSSSQKLGTMSRMMPEVWMVTSTRGRERFGRRKAFTDSSSRGSFPPPAPGPGVPNRSGSHKVKNLQNSSPSDLNASVLQMLTPMLSGTGLLPQGACTGACPPFPGRCARRPEWAATRRRWRKNCVRWAGLPLCPWTGSRSGPVK